MKNIELKIEKIKLTAKKRKIAIGWKFEMNEDGTFYMWYEKPVTVLPDELFEI